MAWHAVMSNEDREARVNERLLDRCYRTFFMHTIDVVDAKVVKRSYLPQYLFVDVEPEELAEVISVRDVIAVLGGDEHPCPIPDPVMAELFEIADPCGTVHLVQNYIRKRHTLVVGDRVKFKDDRVRQFVGCITKVLGDDVLIELVQTLGLTMTVRTHHSNVCRVDNVQ